MPNTESVQTNIKESVHEPVLLHEVVSSLGTPKVFLDGTLGGAGHTLAITKACEGKLTLIGLDRDPSAILRAEKNLVGKAERVILANKNFSEMDQVLNENEVTGVDAILLDLGISSDELDHSGRGFSFLKDEPIHMTMGDPINQTAHPFTAKTIVNEWQEEDIANVIYGYGEERFARRIARGIVNYRVKKQIETSGELAEVIKNSVPAFYRRGKIHPATRTFQAIRIAVNDELGSLKTGLHKGYDALNEGGRMAVISFHSLEDRIVKEFFKECALVGAKILTKKPITPTEQEKAENPRSRSAKMRVIEKHLSKSINKE